MIKKIYELIENKRYADIKRILVKMNEHDIARILDKLSKAELVKIYRLLPKDLAADVFACLKIETEAKLITTLSDAETRVVIRELRASEAADLMEEMPASVVTKLLSTVNDKTRDNINLLLKYPKNSAGSIMTIEYIDLKEYLTVNDALKKIKNEYDEKQALSVCYVTDKKRNLIGMIPLKELVVTKGNPLIGDIMHTDIVSVNTHTDQEEVLRLMQNYDISAIPVVDYEHKLVGVITMLDSLEVMQKEATEDIEKMHAMLPSENEYFGQTTKDVWKSRVPWLLLLMISATFTGQIISNFEASLAIFPILTAYIPMIMDTGGNAGSQASVTIIRAISLDDVHFKDIGKVIWKELKVAICVGGTLAIANFTKIVILDRLVFKYEGLDIKVAAVICLTIFFVIVVAKFIGCTLPLIAKKLKFDPAVMASPFITTIVDALGLLVYFKIAMTVLPFN